MIPAQRQAVREQQRLDLLSLQQNEMQLMRDDYNAIGTTAALLAGFAFTGCADIDMPDGMHPDVKRAFYVLISSTMVLMTYSVVIATICVVLGPDMLVNGAPPGAQAAEISCIVHRATGGMRIARKQIFGSFMGGMILMMASTCLVTFSKLGGENSTAADGFYDEPRDRVAASFVIIVFGLGILAVIVSVHGMHYIFDARRDELFIRNELGDIPCEVCGSRTEEGMTKVARMYWFAFLPDSFRSFLSCRSSASFKCYQCIGQRYSRRDWMLQQASEEEERNRKFGSGDCCGKPEPAPRPLSTPARQEAVPTYRRDLTDQVRMSQRRIDPSSAPFGQRDEPVDWMDEDPVPRQRTSESIGFSDGSFYVLGEDGTRPPANSPTTEKISRSRMSRRTESLRRSHSR